MVFEIAWFLRYHREPLTNRSSVKPIMWHGTDFWLVSVSNSQVPIVNSNDKDTQQQKSELHWNIARVSVISWLWPIGAQQSLSRDLRLLSDWSVSQSDSDTSDTRDWPAKKRIALKYCGGVKGALDLQWLHHHISIWILCRASTIQT